MLHSTYLGGGGAGMEVRCQSVLCQWREQRTETPPPPSLADFVQQLLHRNNCKTDPCSIEFAMMIPRPYGFGEVVARGLNLCMPLRSQNCEFAAPGGEKNCLAANKHSLRMGWRNLPTLRVGWRNFFSSCAVVSVFGSGGK